VTWGRGTLADFMGDRVAYRNLEPADPALPGLCALWQEAGLPRYYIPRKTTREYARVLLLCLQAAQRGRGFTTRLRHALFIGDTLMNDGTAARHVGAHLSMRGFIGADRPSEPLAVEIQRDLMVANRWEALADFVRWVRTEGLPCDESTVLLIDLDKTALGARGRNDSVIDRARVRAIMRTMREALGESPDEATFRRVYDRLNQPGYHAFTADNQDYVAYVCLMVHSGICPAEELWAALGSGALRDMAEFVALCEARRESMSGPLLAAHEEVRRGIAVQDPTPFKAFRRDEYLETVAAMDVLPDGASPDEVLTREIVITAEVASLAGALAQEGVLVFGISDKPDEASLPPEDADPRYLPIHRTVMKVYGQPVA